VDGLELYELGRRLMRAGEVALRGSDGAGLPAGVALIVMDVVEHPGSAIRDIVARTGFPQGHVSASVARLRQRGVLETSVDPDDGRLTLVRVTADFAARVAQRRGMPVDAGLAEVTGIEDPQELAELVTKLGSLAKRILPKHRPVARRTS
jgi:DNA-binding MarR family transcriptional regulator